MTDRKMKWFLLIILTCLSVLSLSLPIIAYQLTRNWLALTPGTGCIPLGFAWVWIIKREFPLNERDHQRAFAAIIYRTIAIGHVIKKNKYILGYINVVLINVEILSAG